MNVKTLIFLGYFLGTFLLARINFFSLGFLLLIFKDLIFWLIGAFLGVNFFRSTWLIKKYIPDFSFDKAFYSSLFQTCWAVLAFFTLTSTAGLFGKALVMAIGLHLLLEEWEDVLASRGISWLFWPIKREVSPREQKWFLWGMTGVFVILTFLLF